MPDFHLSWIKQTLDAVCIGQAAESTDEDGMGRVGGFSIDTRTIQPGQCYVAIEGELLDGHAFVLKAKEAGAHVFLVSNVQHPEVQTLIQQSDGESAANQGDGNQPDQNQLVILVVDDTVEALQALATAHRKRLQASGCCVISVSGSNGKTTTRELIHHALQKAELIGTRSPKSFNNHIGVPLTLLAADFSDEYVVAEVGTNHPGEMAFLGHIVEPNIAVVTSIGQEHLEFLGSIQGVAKEEAGLLAYIQSDGVLICTTEVKQWFKQVGFLDAQRQDCFEIKTPALSDLKCADESAKVLNQILPGQHNLENASLALLVVKQLAGKINPSTIWQDFVPPDGRMQIKIIDEGESIDRQVVVIDDAYNANPSSVEASLNVLKNWPDAKRRVAVLGQMNELGAHGPKAHEQMIEQAKQVADVVILIGQFEGAKPWGDTTADDVADLVKPGDVVLIKGSRSNRLERIFPAIEAKFVD